jgi:hypothetical protein
MPKAPITKKKVNYSLSFDHLDMLDMLVVDTIKSGKMGKKSREVEAAIQLAYDKRFK